MNVTSRRHASASILQIAGRLDQDTCDDFRARLTQEVEEAATRGGAVVLDLSQLEYVSSAGLRCFMLASREARSRAIRVVAAAPQPMVREIFEISHFNLLFQVFPTLAEALAVAAPGTPAATGA